MRVVDQIEISKDELAAYVASHPDGPLTFDGFRYTYEVKMTGLIWNKTVAFEQDGKFYKLVDK